jgi:tetratricopeptide (TPR) repeat protein
LPAGKNVLVHVGGIMPSVIFVLVMLLLGKTFNVRDFYGATGFDVCQPIFFVLFMSIIFFLLPQQRGDSHEIARFLFARRTYKQDWAERQKAGEIIETLIAGDYRKAGALTSRVLRKDPDNRYLRLIEGALKYKGGKYSQCLKVFETLLENNSLPDYRENLLLEVAKLHLMLSNRTGDAHFKKAEKYTQLAFELYQRNPLSCEYRGAVLIELGRYSEGIPLVFRGFKRKAEDSNILKALYLDYAYQKIGQPRMAEKYRRFVQNNEKAMSHETIAICSRITDSTIQAM